MACSLINGNEIQCRDSVGGIESIYVANFTNVQSYSASSGVITSITMVPGTKFYTYQLEKENATYTNDSVGSIENGSTFYNSSVVFTMKKMSASQKNALKVLAQSRLMVIVKDNNGTYFVMGLTRGADALDIKMTSGKAFGDLNGSTVTITGKEPDFDNTYTGSIATITA